MSKTKRILQNGLLLSAVAILMRTVSVAFNAYLKGKLGDGGMGLISLTMSVYGFAVTFATSGIALAVTRLVAEAIGRREEEDASAAMRAAVKYALFFGALAGAALFFASDAISLYLLKDVRTRPSLRLLAFSLPPIALSAALSGYFVAVRRVHHNAATQLCEQGVRIFITVTALAAFLPRGLEYACIAVVGGSSLAELFSFFLLFFQYLHDRRRHLPYKKGGRPNALRRLCSVALPTAGAAWCRSGLITAEHLLIPICLAMGTFSREEALASYATVHGMALPIVLWPTAILSSFAGLLVPEVAESAAACRPREVLSATEKALAGTVLFSCAAAAVLAGTAESLGHLVYRSADVGKYIRILAPLIPVMYLDSAVDAILKGLGKQVYCMAVNILDAASAVLLVRLLLPTMGAEGYLLVIVITEMLNFLFSAGRLVSLVKVRKRTWLFCAACPILAMGAWAASAVLLQAPASALETVLYAVTTLLLYLLPMGILLLLRRKKKKPSLLQEGS